MILLLIPVAAVFLGLGLWAVTRGLGALNVPGVDAYEPLTRRQARAERPRPTSVREWFTSIPSGWLVGVIVVCGVWIVGWLVVLIIGLSFLS